LDSDFDKIVKDEKRSQLLPSVDRLRKNLYTLKSKSEVLRNDTPKERPNKPQVDQLESRIDDLIESVRELGSVVKEISFDLSSDEGKDIAEELTYGLKYRDSVEDSLTKALDERDWLHGENLLKQLSEGITSIEAAQDAATVFWNKLSAL